MSRDTGTVVNRDKETTANTGLGTRRGKKEYSNGRKSHHGIALVALENGSQISDAVGFRS